MFDTWKREKATQTLIDEAQAFADKLAGAKPHFVESHAATVQVWAATYLADGQDLHRLISWPAATVARFARSANTRVAALRKQRAYDSSDGLAIWLHTARAVTEPRIAPAVRDIWQHIANAGQNADAMADDMLEEAVLPKGPGRRVPDGFAGLEDPSELD